MKDSYLREFSAKIVKVGENYVVLDRTAFYPWGGGLESDTGILRVGDREYKVLGVRKDRETGEVRHFVDSVEGLKEGMKVHGIVDWERRYRLMRLHTAAHIIAAVLYENYGVKITGGHITPKYARDDFSIEVENWREAIEGAVKKANEIVERGIEVKIYFLPREEAMKIPGIVKLAERMPPSVKELRIVEIPEVDIQADGGPHVKNTKEIGKIEIMKMENRGKNKKRLYYTVKP